MLKKGSKLYSILKNKCPRCMESSFFKSDHPYKVHMKRFCAHCGLDNKQEPGFYIGAMYASYALGVALGLVTGVTSYFIFHLTLSQILLVIASALLIMAPLNFRLSRLIWINIWVHYDDEVITVLPEPK
jgi:uncharacterized protein (DUF983 family)